MDEKKQIEEMAKVIEQRCNRDCIPSCDECIAQTLYNAGYRKQEWISVDERLPKKLTHVIVCDEDGTVGEAYFFKDSRFEWMDSEELAFVTHWMPLPEPPRMKGGEG